MICQNNRLVGKKSVGVVKGVPAHEKRLYLQHSRTTTNNWQPHRQYHMVFVFA